MVGQEEGGVAGRALGFEHEVAPAVVDQPRDGGDDDQHREDAEIDGTGGSARTNQRPAAGNFTRRQR